MRHIVLGFHCLSLRSASYIWLILTHFWFRDMLSDFWHAELTGLSDRIVFDLIRFLIQKVQKPLDSISIRYRFDSIEKLLSSRETLLATVKLANLQRVIHRDFRSNWHNQLLSLFVNFFTFYCHFLIFFCIQNLLQIESNRIENRRKTFYLICIRFDSIWAKIFDSISSKYDSIWQPCAEVFDGHKTRGLTCSFCASFMLDQL